MGPIADAKGWIAPGEAHLFFPHPRGSSLRDSRRFFDARPLVPNKLLARPAFPPALSLTLRTSLDT